MIFSFFFSFLINLNVWIGIATTFSIPALDIEDSLIEFDLPFNYQDYTTLAITDTSIIVPENYLIANDSLFTVNVPAEAKIPSVFVAIEYLQQKKTPVPDSLSSYVIRQYAFHNVKIDEVERNIIQLENGLDVSRLLFRITESEYYMLNHSFFVNDKTITIGLGSKDKQLLLETADFINSLTIIHN